MADTSLFAQAPRLAGRFLTRGMFWFLVAVAGAVFFFHEGFSALLTAWQKPEYSHGPLIPVLSLFLFLRQLKEVPVRTGPVTDRGPGIALMLFALAFGALGKLSGIDDAVAYALILWIGSMLLISFGWRQGWQFWPPVLHLIYMLPLPDTLYYKLSTWLQFVSSEFGVDILRFIGVPVFLDGNIIDLGVYKLHVAEACSGLRYLFPILSFSYIFAVLYRGPIWHKAVLLISAAPITVLMNSVRIGIAGWIVNAWGIEHVEGFSHFFEGWVIFLACVVILFGLAWLMLRLRRDRMGLAEALDLDTSGLGAQAMRLSLIAPSRALIAAGLIAFAGGAAFLALPDRAAVDVPREPFLLFPTRLGEWEQIGPPEVLEPAVETALGATDYHSIDLASAAAPAPVGFFVAWYADQTNGGTHSPEICLPGSGWEIAWLERVDIAPEIGSATPFHLNRAIIQKGETRMMVYYWFEQRGRRVAWDFGAKLWLLWDGITTGRTDGAMVRLTTLILPDESDAEAEARLRDTLMAAMPVLPRFVPED